MSLKAKVLSTRVSFKGKLFQVTVDRILEPGGIKARREVVRHGVWMTEGFCSSANSATRRGKLFGNW